LISETAPHVRQATRHEAPIQRDQPCDQMHPGSRSQGTSMHDASSHARSESHGISTQSSHSTGLDTFRSSASASALSGVGSISAICVAHELCQLDSVVMLRTAA
jgi:hypothetical protein